MGRLPSGAVLDLGSLRSPAGKKASIAHFDGGARNVARNEAGQHTHTGGARSCSPFSAAKMGGPFSLRCLSPLCSGAVGVGQAYPLRGGMLSCGLGIFATQKASVILCLRWSFVQQKYPSYTETSQTSPFESAQRHLRGSRAAIGGGGKKASTSALHELVKAIQLHCARHCEPRRQNGQ